MESPNLDVGLGSIFTALEFFLIYFFWILEHIWQHLRQK